MKYIPNNLISFNNKRDVDKKAVLAASNEEILEELIFSEEKYIISCAGKTLSKHIAKGSEEEMIALEAFVEAVKNYSFEKGNFLSFAKLVISRRLIDWLRKEKQRENIIITDPSEIIISKDLNDYNNSMLDASNENFLVEEIEKLSVTLKKYGILFNELPAISPKALKTKTACKKVIKCIIENHIILDEVNRKKMLPIKILTKNTGVPEKIIERHRKYIITVVEIYKGDYPYLIHYIKPMTKEM